MLQNKILSKAAINDHTVDPSSPSFDFERWSSTIARLRSELGISPPPRSGFCFKNLTIRGNGVSLGEQQTISTWLAWPYEVWKRFRTIPSRTILYGLDGVVQKGELLLVLGRAGSGCTTFLKTISGEMSNLKVEPSSVLHYSGEIFCTINSDDHSAKSIGIPHEVMAETFKGESLYNQEVDEHLPYLTVGQTLEFAAAMRTPRTRIPGISREDRMKHAVDVLLRVFGLSHTRDTIVGDDFVRGISGGEKKRLSIAETVFAEATIYAWDNSTRGLDAESALGFVKRLRTLSNLTQAANAAAIHQCSQAMINMFDKILILYEGRQIFFGQASSATSYFESMGWYYPPRQPAGDFLTAITNPMQRTPREGFQGRVPRTAMEFENYWHRSPEYAAIQKDIDEYEKRSIPQAEATRREFSLARKQIKSKWMLNRAPQTVSFPLQTRLCIKRRYQQLWNNKTSTYTALLGQVVISLVVGSIFYGTQQSTNAFFSYGSVLFFSVLLNALMAVTDIHSLYSGRSVVQKQTSYAFYRPSADAFAGILADIPIKFVTAVLFNAILYFLSGAERTAAQFFTFFLFVFTATLTMSMVFRTIAAATKTLPTALAISGFLVLTLVTYTGFILPRPYMHPWFKWISYINPLAYVFEALLVNQVHGAKYPCAGLVPPYPDSTGDTFICPVPGAVAGHSFVMGESWCGASYGYSYSHLWRNYGIIIGFLFFFLLTYLVTTEYGKSSSSGPSVLVFSRGHVPRDFLQNDLHREIVHSGPEGQGQISNEPDLHNAACVNTSEESPLHREGKIFSWNKVNLDVLMKGQPRRLLDDAAGWVRPRSLTALMGVSGAGKTTLLNTLAQRSSDCVMTGEFYIDGEPIDASFKGHIGYVQQQDVHLDTSTVREALQLSALLRQPFDIPKQEKMAFVEDVIKVLGLSEVGDAVVGIPGQGLNVEQRKRLSIGVELAARPSRLLFLDEPTSGLDNQSSEAILSLLRKLGAGGLGIICTVHQPSAMLFQQFDRLLLMAQGGRVAYFGDIGDNSDVVLQYFAAHDPRHRTCEESENPAEHLLKLIGDNDSSQPDWAKTWAESSNADDVRREIEQARDSSSERRRKQQKIPTIKQAADNKALNAYPVPLLSQISPICLRVFQNYWRSPSYIASKFMLGCGCSLLIGFSFFQGPASILGVQNKIFSILMICATFSSLIQQIMPRFIAQRTIYEVRERHSNMYSWPVLILANLLVELPYHILLGVCTFTIFNYTVFGIRSAEEQGLVCIFLIHFYILAGTFALMVVAPLPDATTAARLATIMFSMMVLFAGVFQIPTALPRFWIFMYRVSPMTYFVGGTAVSGLSGTPITCSPSEIAVFQPPRGSNCGSYMQPFLDNGAPGALLNPGATANCSYCPLRSADQVLARSGMYYYQRWMDWGVGFAFVAFNIAGAFGFFYLFRVRGVGMIGDWIARHVPLPGRRPRLP
uniref:ABC transporter domain-containing protein n=1 Tax=Bionectria ochroleuca TaxID=29856 RepID=A0A0B7JQ34_BIOOC